ncbi:MAG: hypothetical protein KGQ41_01170 [Alphaproteobacteria bacterium]|nr:hypothetical protein [Alphaproteobacteria bacterium]
MQAQNTITEKPHGLRHEFGALRHASSAVIDLHEDTTTVKITIHGKDTTIDIIALQTCIESNTDTGGIAEQIYAAFVLAVSGRARQMPNTTLTPEGNVAISLGNSVYTGASRLTAH